jgi:hypothetical protein
MFDSIFQVIEEVAAYLGDGELFDDELRAFRVEARAKFWTQPSHDFFLEL